ncbi:MAG: mechanosensitive ion channel domain-containing protein [Elainellaceae cyanobacterium]
MAEFGENIQSILDASLLRIGGASISLSAIAQFLLALLIVLVISISLKRILANQLLARIGISQGNREAIATIVSYSVGTLCFIGLLQAVGVNFASLAVLAGGLGIGVGFGLQEITKNFISGLTLLIERQLKVGDFIELDALSGYIAEISLRSTVIRTITRKYVVVPNSDLMTSRVINWTFYNSKGWVSIPVKVAHGSDPVLVIEVLLDSAYLEETVSYEYPAEVYFKGFSDYSLNFELWVWVHQIDRKFITESSLYFIIEHNLRQHGIKLASPKLDLWQQNPSIVVHSPLDNYDRHNGHRILHNEPLQITDQPSRPFAVRDLLRQVPYFEKCTELELRKLIEIGHRKRLDAGEILFREGDPSDAFYIILSGRVEYAIERLKQSPSPLGAGDFVGDLSLMLSINRTFTVWATEETTLFEISPDGFKKLLRDQPKLYDTLVQELGKYQEDLSHQQKQLRSLGILNAEEYDLNPVAWVRKQLEKLFTLN